MVNHPNRKKAENTLFPGRYNYTGPTKGWFGFLHHEQLYEESHDVNERIEYVKREKPKNGVAIRLHNMIYLGGCEAIAKLATLNADYNAKRATLDADYNAKLATLNADYNAKLATLYADYNAKLATLYADYDAKRAPLDAEIFTYIKINIPDCAWNGKTLVFP
jgi:outer membrane murein-binding lipoprotein Lpp